MVLSIWDWAIIAAYLLLSLYIGLKYREQAGKSLSDFFLGGRTLPWHIAGLSMVATTFAADTPLAVTELVAKNGISGNWLWWNMLIGGMLTTFFFAKLWRRAEILTELEFVEIRYSGKPAAFLRGFKAVYLGIIMNCIIIGWVNVALISILKVFFNLPENQVLWYTLAAMLITAVYSTLSGLKGVAITDAIQFGIAMIGCIVLAILVVNSDKIGGIDGLKAKLPSWSLSFFPTISSKTPASGVASTLSISIGAFFAYSLVQWWSSWYPGAEPGGGGYVAQRMMSAKNEKHSVYATLFFQIAHYCVRPWPWIFVGLCAIILYPDLADSDKKLGYVLAMRDYLPIGLKGLLLVAFLAAYMSTISTQLNWGASYITNDLYRRFIKPESKFKSEADAQKQYVLIGKVSTVIIMLLALIATSMIKTISGVWSFIIECGAGLGLVLILRWYWWRINAWSEITATVVPFIAYAISRFVLKWEYPNGFFFTVGVTTVSWIIITFITKPTAQNILEKFYIKVRPGGAWKKIALATGVTNPDSNTGSLFACWISSIVMTYSVLFLLGKIIFRDWDGLYIWALCGFGAFLVLRRFLQKAIV